MRRSAFFGPFRWKAFPVFFLSFIAACTLSPTFSPPQPDLLIEQLPARKPLFVDHPPKDSPTMLWFIAHIHKGSTPDGAEKDTLSQAFGKFGDRLSRKGYSLTQEEQDRWFRLGTDSKSPHLADRWIRTYKESQDKPFIHLTSVYLLLGVPRAYETEILESLVRKDRKAALLMKKKLAAAQAALNHSNGTRLLENLRDALLADRTIHSDFSFFQGSRAVKRRKTVESLWRQSLRGIHLALKPPSDKFSVGEFPIPPVTLKEESFLRIRSKVIGVSGLSFRPTLRPFTPPEHLVFPGMAWLIGNPRPILSRETIEWEYHLFRQPPYRLRFPLKMACSPTGPDGTGKCLLASIHVPGHHGTIEGFYQPVPGTSFDRPFFRTFFKKTLLDVHFRFYHRRTLHPLILSFSGLPPDLQKEVSSYFIEKGHKTDLTICLPSKGTFDCPNGPPASLIKSTEQGFIFIRLISQRMTTTNHRDFAISTSHLYLSMTLSDRHGVFWAKERKITGRGLSQKEATSAAWKESARTLAGDLSLVFYPPARVHPGEDFHDH